MNVKICVPVPPRSLHETLSMIQAAEKSGADMIEVRFDYMGLDVISNLDKLREIAKCCSTPLIATNRHVEQGGKFKLDEERRLETLIKAAEAGFEYVDIEFTTKGLSEIANAIKAYNASVIISFHDFGCTPTINEMRKIAEKQIEAGADICKIVAMAHNIMDSINCLVFTYEMSKKTNLVCFAMGENGLLSRILSPLFGASFTYASLERGLETAPGQITISELREIYRRLGVQS